MPVTTFHDLAPGTQRALLAGAALFNARQFFEAHEAWEDAWLGEDGDTKTLLQALIQLTAAYHKGLVMGSPRGMSTLFAHAGEKFEGLARAAGSLGGVAIAPLVAEAAAGRKAAESWAIGEQMAFVGTPGTLQVNETA
jgi:predicted metal-dependent hydrolase